MVPITAQTLTDLFCQGNDVGLTIRHAIPVGSRLMAVHYDARTHTFFLKFQHESFDKVMEGDQFPLVKPLSIHIFDLPEDIKKQIEDTLEREGGQTDG